MEIDNRVDLETVVKLSQGLEERLYQRILAIPLAEVEPLEELVMTLGRVSFMKDGAERGLAVLDGRIRII